MSIREYFQALSNGEARPHDYYPPGGLIPDGLKGAIIGILNKAVRGDANRKLVLKYLANVTSSTALTDGQWYALLCLVRPYKDSALGWISDNPKFRSAVDAIITDMARLEGQIGFLEDENNPVNSLTNSGG